MSGHLHDSFNRHLGLADRRSTEVEVLRSVLRAHLWKFILVVGLAAAVAAAALPPAHREAFETAVGLVSVLFVAAGILVNRPADRLSWMLLAAGTACFFAADAVRYLERTLGGRTLTFPSATNAISLAGSALLLVAVLRLSHNPDWRPGRDDYADASIVTIAAVALLWYYVLGPRVHDPSLSSMALAVLVTTTVVDILLVGVLFFTLVSGLPLRSGRGILAAALVALFAGDFTAGVAVAHGLAPDDGLVTAWDVLAFVLIGVAALHPAIGDPLSRDPVPAPSVYVRHDGARHRLPLVAVAGCVPLIILLVASTDGLAADVTFMASAALAVTALLFLRTMWLIARISGQADELETHARALQASHRQRDTLEADLRHLAFHDELTGLANRALLHDRVEHALAALPRHGRTVALCFGDLDGFKTVNDTLGHDVGDQLLRRVSRLLSSIVRPGDTVARLGGDEFAVLMVDVEREQAAVDFAHRIVSVLSSAPDFEGQPVGLSISVGVAFAEPGKSTEQFLTEADSAMYEAKEAGKNQVKVFESSMRSRMLERLEMTNGFRWALGRSEIFLQYQPIVSLSDWSLHGFEALVRWSHPSLGLLRPLQFVPIAEETGFIVPLGRWVLAEACEQIAGWSRDSGQRLRLAVNVSGRQLKSLRLADEVRTALELSGLQPDQLVLEVTEQVLVEDLQQSAAALHELRSIGVRIGVDDFGTGHAALGHLQRLPLDVVKIDKSFIDPLAGTSGPDGSPLLAAVIALAQNLGLDVIAEGIEHDDQLRRLVELGCTKGQGFLMAHPLDPNEARSLVGDYALSAVT